MQCVRHNSHINMCYVWQAKKGVNEAGWEKIIIIMIMIITIKVNKIMIVKQHPEMTLLLFGTLRVSPRQRPSRIASAMWYPHYGNPNLAYIAQSTRTEKRMW